MSRAEREAIEQAFGGTLRQSNNFVPGRIPTHAGSRLGGGIHDYIDQLQRAANVPPHLQTYTGSQGYRSDAAAQTTTDATGYSFVDPRSAANAERQRVGPTVARAPYLQASFEDGLLKRISALEVDMRRTEMTLKRLEQKLEGLSAAVEARGGGKK